MAVRVRDFYRAHPSADANHASVLGRLDEAIGRMEVLVAQQVGGVLSKRSSVLRRKDLRRRLNGGLLRHLVTIAGSAAEEKPELVEKYRLPSGNASNKLFRTVARKMLDQGVAEKELLVKHGLSATLLDDLSAAIDEFDASVAETSGGTLDHVLARAELETLSDEGECDSSGCWTESTGIGSSGIRSCWWRGRRRSTWCRGRRRRRRRSRHRARISRRRGR